MSRRRRHAIGSSALFALMVGGRGAHADGGEPLEVQAERLEHTLTYLAADYLGGAPSGAVAADDDERSEHLALAAEAERLAARLPGPPDLVDRVRGVRVLIQRLAPVADVEAAVADLRTTLVGTYALAEAPEGTPNVARGRALFEEHCATCHGATGHADTPRAASLKPHPADFFDPRIGEPLSPYRVTLAVRFGISGTAMIPFTFLGDADRWNLGFFVMGLRHVAPPIRDAPMFGRGELARASDGELRVDLRAAGIAERDVESLLTDLRRRAGYDEDGSRSAMAGAREDLGRARLALGRGARTEALAAVRAAELGGVARCDIALERVDAELAASVRDAFAHLRDSIERGAPTREADRAVALTLRAIARADRALWNAYGTPSFATSAVRATGMFARTVADAALTVAALLAGGAAAARARTKPVHAASIAAVGLGAATWIGFRWTGGVPSRGRDAVSGALAVIAACALVYLLVASAASSRRSPPSSHAPGALPRAAAVVFAVAFLVAARGAFDAATLFASLSSCGLPAAALGVGIGAASVSLAALAFAIARVARLASPVMRLRVSRFALGAFGAIIAASGIASLHRAAAARVPSAVAADVAGAATANARRDGEGLGTGDPQRGTVAARAGLSAEGGGTDAAVPFKSSPAMRSFRVLSYRVDDQGSDVRARLALVEPIDSAHRAELDALLADLAAQIHPIGEGAVDAQRVPVTEISIEVFQPDAQTLVGRIEGDEGEPPSTSDLLPRTFRQAILFAIQSDAFRRERRPTVDVDEANHRAKIEVPYVDPATGDWASALSPAGVARIVAEDVTALFNGVAPLDELALTVRWRDRTLVRIELDRREVGALGLDTLRSRVNAQPPDARDAFARAALREAFARLPAARVVLDPSLR